MFAVFWTDSGVEKVQKLAGQRFGEDCEGEKAEEMKKVGCWFYVLSHQGPPAVCWGLVDTLLDGSTGSSKWGSRAQRWEAASCREVSGSPG